MTQTVERPADLGLTAGPGQVLGVHCKKQHFNDPRVYYCGVCGMAMAQTTRVPVLGARPQLGVLVLDTGAVIPVQRDLVVGRSPDVDLTVAEGVAVPVRLPDVTLSRLHLKVVLRDWDVTVVDVGSSNGTFVVGPDGEWRQLRDGATAPLRPGSTVLAGRHRLRYYSNRNP